MSPVEFVTQDHLVFANAAPPVDRSTVPETVSPITQQQRSDDSFMWFLAFWPVLSTILTYGVGFWLGLAITVTVNVLMCTLDANKLKAQGFDPPSAFWALVFVPAYILMRPGRVGGGYGYGITWMVCFILSLLPSLAAQPS
jgi:hypothetical protein